MDEVEDILIQRCKKGDEMAFEEVYKHYAKRVFNLALRMIGNSTEAEDALQETFLKAFKKIDTYKNGMKFSNWVLKIASNTVIDMLRKKGDYYSDFNREDIKNLYSAEYNLELNSDIKRAILALKPSYRLCVILRDVYGYSYEEISEILGKKLGTVKSDVCRARATLLKNIEV